VSSLSQTQLNAFQTVMATLTPGNAFYLDKYQHAGIDLNQTWTPEAFYKLPFTVKSELSADQIEHPPYGSALSFPLESYTRLHQTSGTTTNRAMRWLDTASSWAWLTNCWRTIFQLAKITSADRVYFPFSFGPFLGFWSAFDAAAQMGMLALPGGGMSTTARLRFLLEHRATVLCCTPTYAVHLADVAASEQLDIASSDIRAVIVAGEPGGSIPSTRLRIEQAWGARVFDHYGMTEVGPVAAECEEAPGGLHILEDDFIAEVLDAETGLPVPAGTTGELVVTNLGRHGSPLIRYRTGDVVMLDPEPCRCGRTWCKLFGGVQGRTDDMIHIRGNNLYPSAIEAVVRRFPEIVEFRIIVDRSGPLADLKVQVEASAGHDTPQLVHAVGQAIRDALLFRAEVVLMPVNSLPRYEMKARRVVIQ